MVGEKGLQTYCGSPQVCLVRRRVPQRSCIDLSAQYYAPEVLRRRDSVMGQGRYGAVTR